MKLRRFTGMILFIATIIAVLLPVSAAAANDNGIIDVSNAQQGYFTVNYSGTTERMKVGVTVNGATKYSDYTAGTVGNYSFAEGNGAYKIELFVNVGGTSYKRVASTEVNVTLNSAYSQFLVSTSEISFPAGGAVAQKAAELCVGKRTDEEKAVAIYRYMLSFSYDYFLSDRITAGSVIGYVPDTAAILSTGRGICYDFSALFAAMCRSQGIPCKLIKGTYNNGQHAWNEVLCNGKWYQIDMTYSIQYKANANDIEGCVTPLNGYAVNGVPSKVENETKPLAAVAEKQTEKKETVKASAVSFSDVKSGDYFFKPVNWAVECGITNGTSETTFSANDTCTTAQIITFLWRACGSQEPSIANPFSNLAENTYYYKAAVWAFEQGIISGTSFNANEACTRAATVTYIWRHAGSQKASAQVSFADISTSSCTSAVAWAVENGITSGTSETTFSPDNICSRGQIVTFLYRYLAA